MPRIAFLLFLLALLVPGPGLLADASPEATRSQRVVIAPLNLGVRATPDVEPGIEPVWQELVRHFETQDPPPASLAPEGAAALWSSAVAEAGGDAPEERDVYAAYASFARRVAEHVDYGTLVIPSLVTRKADLHGNQASWDGVRRFVETPMGASGNIANAHNFWITTNGMNGALRAASLHVAVFSPDGELRFEGAGGLALLQRVEMSEGNDGNQLAVAERDAPFDDSDALRAGIEAAFTRQLPASRAR